MLTIDLTLLIQVINMIVLMILLNRVLYQPVRRIIKERSEHLNSLQSEISRFDQDARERRESVNAQMSQAAVQAKATLDQGRSEAQADAGQRLDARKKVAQADKERQTAMIREQMLTARQALENELQGFASQMAGKILGRSL
ncbi:MAG: ATP synthase F0 subunit B [Desulfobulbaceae bacterium]|jgi:F-type H+-transporting ATPase subunit b|nr:ATP synthase F0 subunit B [Desulfobulbaceae bacterium]